MAEGTKEWKPLGGHAQYLAEARMELVSTETDGKVLRLTLEGRSGVHYTMTVETAVCSNAPGESPRNAALVRLEGVEVWRAK